MLVPLAGGFDIPGLAICCSIIIAMELLSDFVSKIMVNPKQHDISQDDRQSSMDEVGPAEEFDLRALRQRLRDYLMTHYLGLHITIVSVALAIAGLSAAGLVTQHGIGAVDLALLCLLWLGSLLATAVAYDRRRAE